MRIKSTLLGLALLLAGNANAAFILTLDDLATMGVDETLTDDNADGLITFNGAVGVFTVNVTTGISKPLAPSPQLMDLNSINVSSGAAGELEIILTDTGFTAPPLAGPYSLTIVANVRHADGGGISSFDAEIRGTDTAFEGFYGGTAPSDGGVDIDLCFDTTNTEFGCDSPFLSAPDNVNDFSGSGSVVIPVPPAVWLFGSGLLGLMGIARRRG